MNVSDLCSVQQQALPFAKMSCNPLPSYYSNNLKTTPYFSISLIFCGYSVYLKFFSSFFFFQSVSCEPL